MTAAEQPEGVTIAEMTGYAGGNHGPAGPLVQLAMAQAVVDANGLGIADDTPHEKLVEIVGADKLTALLGDDAGTAVGADYIRTSKLNARAAVLDEHRGLVKAHEGGKAAALHNARDA